MDKLAVLDSNVMQKSLRQEIAANKSDANLTTGQNKFGDNRDTYEKRMYLIASDSYHASAQNPTDVELASRSETWTRLLFNIIPEKMLKACFDEAFKNHEGVFPVSAYELKDAWQAVKDRERERIIASRRALPDAAASACTHCFGTGMWNPDGRGMRNGCPHPIGK